MSLANTTGSMVMTRLWPLVFGTLDSNDFMFFISNNRVKKHECEFLYIFENVFYYRDYILFKNGALRNWPMKL